MEGKRKVNKKNLTFLFLFTLVILTLDYSASKYNTGILFKRYNQIPFNFNIESYEGRYHLWSDSAFSIIYNGAKFPNIINEKNVFVNELQSFSVIDKSLGVLIRDTKKNFHIIKIDSIGYDGAPDRYQIISDTIRLKKLMNVYKWIDIKPNFKLHFFVYFWPNLFWLLLIIIILYPTIKIYNWKFRNQK